jgi:hypothetical protein
MNGKGSITQFYNYKQKILLQITYETKFAFLYLKVYWFTYALKVCSLIFQNSHLSIEEFHSKLQEATNFPLRPFVIPFLKVGVSIH